MLDKTIDYSSRVVSGRARIFTREEERIFAKYWFRRWMAGDTVSSSPPDGYCARYPGTAVSEADLIVARAEKLMQLIRDYRHDLTDKERAFIEQMAEFRLADGDENFEYRPTDVGPLGA